MNNKEYDFYKRAVTVFCPIETDTRQSEFIVESRGHLVPSSKASVLYQPQDLSGEESHEYEYAPLNQRISFSCNPLGLPPHENNILQAVILFPLALNINSRVENESENWAMEGISPILLSNLFYPYRNIEWQAVYALCNLSSENLVTKCIEKEQRKLEKAPA